MPSPAVGETVPDFALHEFKHGTTQRLSETTQRNPTIVAFFKRSCATSQLTLPFIERLHQHYPSLQLLGISQDDLSDTTTFVAQTGVTFPVLMDSDWKVSTEYDLFTVPSVFLLDSTRKLVRLNLGWNREHYNALSQDIARLLNVPPVTLVTDSDKVPAFKPG